MEGEDPTLLHELLASARLVRGRRAASSLAGTQSDRSAGAAVQLLTADGMRLQVHYRADSFSSLKSIMVVFDMLWEDMEVVDEEHLPMYSELERFGFAACADAILFLHGGMHEVADVLDRKGPWQLPLERRRQRRQGWLLNLATWNWMQVLRAVKQLADESPSPEHMPSYKSIKDEGLEMVAIALRNRSTLQSRPSRRSLVPPPSSGRFWAAQQLGLLTSPTRPPSATFPHTGASHSERENAYLVKPDRDAMLERYADIRTLRQAVLVSSRL